MGQADEKLYEQMLVLRCQTGDERAFEELVTKFTPGLRDYLRLRAPAAADGEGLLQEIWFEAYRQLPRLRERRAFRGWLYRIARDRAAREFRRRGWRPVELRSEPAATEHQEDELASEQRERLGECLEQLSAEHRAVLRLRYLENRSYEQIAQALGCPVGTVRSRIHYAKEALKGLWQEDSHEN